MPAEHMNLAHIEALNRRYCDTIGAIEEICKDIPFHVHVGGTFTDLIGPKTTFTISPVSRTLILANYLPPTMIRSDGTPKDIDMIVGVKKKLDFLKLKERLKALTPTNKNHELFPSISVEPILYYPEWKPRNAIFQLVSGIDVDQANTPFLVFGFNRTPISWKSLEKWKVTAGHLEFATLNPFAHALRYPMRVPSGVKKKDKEIKVENDFRFNKMSLLMRLANQIYIAGLEVGIDYKNENYYLPWKEFLINGFLKKQSALTKVKAGITGWFWNSIGTEIAHGKGFLEPFSHLSDRFTG
jgi:hypothetical protein